MNFHVVSSPSLICETMQKWEKINLNFWWSVENFGQFSWMFNPRASKQVSWKKADKADVHRQGLEAACWFTGNMQPWKWREFSDFHNFSIVEKLKLWKWKHWSYFPALFHRSCCQLQSTPPFASCVLLGMISPKGLIRLKNMRPSLLWPTL